MVPLCPLWYYISKENFLPTLARRFYYVYGYVSTRLRQVLV